MAEAKCKNCHQVMVNSDYFFINKLLQIFCKNCHQSNLQMQWIQVKAKRSCIFKRMYSCSKCHYVCSILDMAICKACHERSCQPPVNIGPCSPEQLIFFSICSCGAEAEFFDTINKQYKCVNCCNPNEDNIQSKVQADSEQFEQEFSSLELLCIEIERKNNSIMRKLRKNYRVMASVSINTVENLHDMMSNTQENMKSTGKVHDKLLSIMSILKGGHLKAILVEAIGEGRVSLCDIKNVLGETSTYIHDECSVSVSAFVPRITFDLVPLIASQPSVDQQQQQVTLSPNPGPSWSMLGDICLDLEDDSFSEETTTLPGPLITFDEEAFTTEVIANRGPNWLILVEKNCETKRKDIIKSLEKFKESKMSIEQIKQGCHVVVKESPKYGSIYKRGVITRGAEVSRRWAIFLSDFGRSVEVSHDKIHVIPQDLDGVENTVFIAQLVGIKPVSGFIYTESCKPNAVTLIRSLIPSNQLVQVKRKASIADTLFVSIESYIQGKKIDWTSEFIKQRVAMSCDDNGGYFIPEKNYCYLFHALNRCYSNHCNRLHICPFCKTDTKHRVMNCVKYQNAEKNYLQAQN